MIAAAIQARFTSTRLPGKMLMEFEGRTVIEHLIGRLRQVPAIGRIAVSIPSGDDQTPLVEHVESLGILVSRGPTDDILKRMLNAAEAAGAARVVRVFGDSPMIDPAVIAKMLDDHATSGAQWARVDVASGWPHGNEVQSFDTELLSSIDVEARTFDERQDIQPYLLRFPDRFRMFDVRRPGRPKNPENQIELMLDTPADRDRLARIFRRLYSGDPCFGVDAIEALAQAAPQLFDRGPV